MKRRDTINRRALIKSAGAFAGTAAVVSALGAPHVASAQSGAIRIGMPTILSGRVAILGTSSRTAAEIAVKKFNDEGGLDGRMIDLIVRDSKASPDEAARVTRDLINSEGCEIIIDGEASSGSFAVQEVIRQLGVLCIHTNSETSSLTADPKIRSATAFRSARQGIHDAVSGGLYASKIAKEEGKLRWMTCSPDYAYGRDNTAQFLEYLKMYNDQTEVVDQLWPKLFEPDYTASVTRIQQQAPDAVYSALWGGDLVSFIGQGNLYGLFSGGMGYFSGGLADPPILDAINQLPAGLHSVYRYDPDYPDTEENKAFASTYSAIANQLPTNWSWQTYTAVGFITEALRRTSGSTDGMTLAKEIAGMEIASPFSETGKITMREDDHTIINYPVAWGKTMNDPKSMTGWTAGDWSEILAQEKEWKVRQGYT
jgi:branched-chain amino acid transport system substrate-binding protein